MCNKKHRLSLAYQITDCFKQSLHFLVWKNRRGLVQNNNISFSIKYLYNLYLLLHSNRQISDQRLKLKMKSIFRADFFDLCFACFFVDKAALFNALIAHDDIVKNRKTVKQHKLLLHHTNSRSVCIIRIAENLIFSVQLNCSGIRADYTGNDIHQRTFSGAIFADNGMNAAFFYFQTYILVRCKASVILVYIAQF